MHANPFCNPSQNHFDGDFEQRNSAYNSKIISRAHSWAIADYSVSCASGLSDVDIGKNIIYKNKSEISEPFR